MASSLALKRLISSSNILPASFRVASASSSRLLNSAATPDDHRLQNDDRRHAPSLPRRDLFVPFTPTRNLTQFPHRMDQFTATKGEDTKEDKKILRPLSPHLPVYKPQLNSTLSITNRISGVVLTTMVLFSSLLAVQMGSICLTFPSFYQFFFYSAKLLPVSGSIAALAVTYHLCYGIKHLIADFRG